MFTDDDPPLYFIAVGRSWQLLQVWCYNNSNRNVYTFYTRSLAVARFD